MNDRFLEGSLSIGQGCLLIQQHTLNNVRDVSNLKYDQKKNTYGKYRCHYPMEFVHMDYLTIEAHESDKDVHIFVITYHFT